MGTVAAPGCTPSHSKVDHPLLLLLLLLTEHSHPHPAAAAAAGESAAVYSKGVTAQSLTTVAVQCHSHLARFTGTRVQQLEGQGWLQDLGLPHGLSHTSHSAAAAAETA